MSADSNLRIDGKRLWDSLMEMAQIGGTPKGGVNRLTLTDLDRQSRDLFGEWCRKAGCTIKIDKMGIGKPKGVVETQAAKDQK